MKRQEMRDTSGPGCGCLAVLASAAVFFLCIWGLFRLVGWLFL